MNIKVSLLLLLLVAACGNPAPATVPVPPAPAPVPVPAPPNLAGDTLLITDPTGLIYTMHSDGTGKSATLATGSLAALSYDKSQIAYTDTAGLWTMNLDGTGKKNIAQGAQAPSWSRDGKLAFTGPIVSSQKAGMYVIKSGGSAALLITPAENFSYFGMLSPDGTKMCYTLDTATDRQIHVVNADGSGDYALTHSTDDVLGPNANGCAWNHAGTQVAFFCGVEANNPNQKLHQNICTISPDGTGRKTLTSCDGSPFDPANPNGCTADGPFWSPDDSHIGYSKGSVTLGGTQTWIMDADGSDQRMLLAYPYGGGRQPWE